MANRNPLFSGNWKAQTHNRPLPPPPPVPQQKSLIERMDNAMWESLTKNLNADLSTPARTKEGRQAPVYGKKQTMVACTLKTVDDRKLCKHWDNNRQSCDCLYFLDHDEPHCWLGDTKPFE